MRADIYWIPGTCDGRLAIMPRPRAGEWLEDELKAWHGSGVDVVVSLLTPPEVMELGLQDEPGICRENQMDFITCPIYDRQVPASPTIAIELVRKIREFLAQGKGVAIHCRMGIGRSALVAACVMVSLGLHTKIAFDLIEEARGVPVPDTDEQKRWVESLSTKLANTFHPQHQTEAFSDNKPLLSFD
jgi:hypothetical protein